MLYKMLLSAALVLCAANLSKAIWISGYYAGWTQYTMAPENIDFEAITHLIHFSFMPGAAGALNDDFGLSDSHIKATVAAGHNAGKKVILCIGGAGSGQGFLDATTTANRQIFISNIINKLTNYGYDGIDIDWEPVTSPDSGQFIPFIQELRAALDTAGPGLLLTAACGDDYFDPEQRNLWVRIQDQMDQMNLMTYVMSAPWPGWITWHGSALYNGGQGFPSFPARPLPCADEWVNNWLEAGILPERLGIGIEFSGDIWGGGTGTSTGGVSEPYQSWITEPTFSGDVDYTILMNNYYNASRYHYDTLAEAPYLSINEPGSANDNFITYTDAPAISAKINYIASKKIGGCIIWQLAHDYFGPGNSPLKVAVKQALATLNIEKEETEVPARPSPAFTVFPNPVTSSAINLRLQPHQGACFLIITNILGRIVYEKTLIGNNITLGFELLKQGMSESGIYYFSVSDGKTRMVNRVIRLN